MFTFTMSETQARNIHNMARSHTQALKNWMATAVEAGNLDRAQELCRELRQHEEIFAAFNMQAKHEIAEHTGKPVQTEITVRNN